MPKIARIFSILTLLLGVWILPTTLDAQSQLKSIFVTPPDVAKPRAYWLFGQGNYDYTQITSDLKAYKEMGYAGLDIFDLGIGDPYNKVPSGPAYMSDEQLDGVVFAMKEAKKLGLRMGMSVSNGWNAGGDWTTNDEMSMNMLFSKDTVQGPLKISKIKFPSIPTFCTKVFGKFPLYPIIGKDGFPEYYENVSLVAYPLTENGLIGSLDQVIRFDTKKINGNVVDIELPAGKWVLLRSVVSPLGQKMWASSDNSHGYIMDHFSEKATNHHFSHLFNRLESRMGTLKGSALERFYLCSFESEATTEWSPALADYFFKLNGYSIDPYIPILAGQKVVDNETTQRFLHDYRYAISEMFVNNHYRQARKMCNDKGLLIASESGGPGPPVHRVPTEDYKALGAVDVMRGEFWNNINQAEFNDERGGDILSVIKNVAGAAHVYGRKVVEMEAFTGRKHWRENPLELKKLADYAFCNGMTRVVYHTGTLSPKEAGLPGWSYGAGTHIAPNLSWWSLSKPMHDYFARVGGMLLQGNFVADVAYYRGEDVPNFGIGYKYTKETLGEGFDYDDINTEILLQTTDVENGKIKLPCGMTYSVLVLPNNGKMSIEVLRVIENLLQKGATIIGNKPTTVYGLANFKAREAEMIELANKIWGTSSAKRQIRKYGNGQLITGYTEKEILTKQGIAPDLLAKAENKTSKLAYIHRSTDKEEIYFVSNTDSVPVTAQVQFRATGMQPQLWNPVTAETTVLSDYMVDAKKTTCSISLSGYGSVFVIFSKELPSKLGVFSTKKSIDARSISSLSLNGPWDVRFTYGYGFDPIQKFDSLVDWRNHSNKELSSYSGLASYKLAFNVSKEFLSTNNSYSISLGKVGEVARVYLNGV